MQNKFYVYENKPFTYEIFTNVQILLKNHSIYSVDNTYAII